MFKILFITITALTIILHYHYYRWGIFNPKSNCPVAYRRDGFGIAIVHISKLIWFISLLMVFQWYWFLAQLIFLFITKWVAFIHAILSTTNEYIKYNNMSKSDARATALREVRNYYKTMQL